MQPDIRKWFMKQHDKGNDNGNTSKPAKPTLTIPGKLSTAKDVSPSSPVKSVQGGQESSGRRKTSKYFATDKQNQEDATEVSGLAAKRKVERSREQSSPDVKPPPGKKLHTVDDNDKDDDFVLPKTGKNSVEVTPSKKLKSGSGKGIPHGSVNESTDADDSPKNPKSAGRGRGRRGGSVVGKGTKLDIDEDNAEDEDTKEVKSGGRGRGRGGRGGSAVAGSGRGGGRGGFMAFGERKDPPHKGEKEVPEGSPDCLAGLTFVISGTLDSLEREEAEDLIKRYGGRVTGSVSKKTNYLLCDEDIGGRKSEKAKELGTGFLTEDGLFDMIRASNRSKATTKDNTKKQVDTIATSLPKASPQIATSLPKESPQKGVKKKDEVHESPEKGRATRNASSGISPAKRKKQTVGNSSLPWTEKYKPKVPNDIIGNQSLVKQLHDWLTHWNENFLGGVSKGKGKKQSDMGTKKAILLSGTPGIGKTTSAKLVSQMLGFQTIEVNASDSRGKADAKIEKGIGSSTANSVKELVSNQSLSVGMDRSKHPKAVLIMDEVDGMSAGDRGGVADLISSIKISKIPIICICNDRYSQKLKSLVNYCLLLSFRKPTKQQMAKRLLQIANGEGLQVNEVALEELAERVNGDMRMALNQLQYMSLSMSVIKYDDIRQRLLSSSKDEDISPFTAVDKLFGYNAAKLRMDERFDLSMSDPDLVPLIIQENYMNYRPSAVGKDEHGIKRMSLIARAADSIASGDIINVQIRRYRQWQLSQSSSLTSSIIPAALLRGQRETLEPGERNFNRFGGWLGKNSTMGKNYRLLEDVHVHLLASSQFNSARTTLCLDYLSLLLKQMTDPLKMLPKDEAVEKVVEFMDAYSINQEDFESLMLMAKFQGRPNPLDGVQPAVKAALTKAYNKGSRSRVIRTADLITLPGIKKAPKKRVAAMLEPVDDGVGENGDAIAEKEENNSDTEDLEGTADAEEKPKVDIESLSSKGIQVQMNLKGAATKKTASGKGRGGGSTGSASKRKR
ncbi:replication factor C subunit 1 [Cynara cardunculus var. scolymus]|uniref:replication factor C subunit 1 n=1 Tax=Cynara cardunculus var. scolymus TaxID=59895 RepID=UPI000D62BCDE|nr:replication factor C subunit 1 [Cynara cardunculus var. scolymus]XP_024987692.1 replication factor C subunit 1 [Cynara cardunculus var. scolymus]XP_024987693.1 replication factor C subunit 1 [Cynara cardunculus var. scolymus]